MRYLFKRGKGARRRVVHLAGFDPRSGEVVMQPLCGRVGLRFDTTSNVPWGQRTCRWCKEAAS